MATKPTDGDAAIVIRGLVCGYGDRVVLDVPELRIRRGRITCVLGPSGCGKSTLLRNILLLERPRAGTVLVDGADVTEPDGRSLAAFRGRAGVLFQGAALFNSLTLLENVAFPILERGGTSRELARRVAAQKLELVGLTEFGTFLPAELSGGMRKRAGIARAIALDPDYLFLDEPSAGLDPITAAEIDALVQSIRDQFGTTIVSITHELASLHLVAEELVVLADGKLRATGTLEAVKAVDDPMIRDFFERRAPERKDASRPFAGRLEPGRSAT